MSLAHQTIRNILHQRCQYTSFSKKTVGYRKLHSLHGLSFSRSIRPEWKLNTSPLGKFGNAKTLGVGCYNVFGSNSAAIFVITRNESTNSSVSHDLSSSGTSTASGSVDDILNKTVPTSTADLPSQDITLTTSNTDHSDHLNSEAVTAIPSSADTLIFEKIPDAPAIPVEEITQAILAGGEPTFTSLGLGGWYPTGIVQSCLEYFHVGLGMPWWGAILTGTIIVRLMLFPLVLASQRNAAKMTNNMPQMTLLQMKMTEARQMGNSLMAAKYANDLMVFMKEKEIKPFKSMLVPLAMVPFFMSFFFGLRKMANLPVESLKTGGMFWFTDLTMADPYYILPLVTSVTVWITLELGADGMKMNAQQHGHLMKYVMRGIPIIMFPFTLNFPGAMLCYWVSTNAISLIQVSVLKIPAVREVLKIDAPIKLNPDQMPSEKQKGFRDSLKDTWTNMKITREVEDRVRFDEITFKRAGKGPIPKTYKYDPTKASPVSQLSSTAVQAKQK